MLMRLLRKRLNLYQAIRNRALDKMKRLQISSEQIFFQMYKEPSEANQCIEKWNRWTACFFTSIFRRFDRECNEMAKCIRVYPANREINPTCEGLGEKQQRSTQEFFPIRSNILCSVYLIIYLART